MGLRELGDWVYDAKLLVEIRYQFQYICMGNKIFLLTAVEVLIIFFYPKYITILSCQWERSTLLVFYYKSNPNNTAILYTTT